MFSILMTMEKHSGLSQTLEIPGSNEATAAEISGNGLILNARNQKGDIKARIVALSKNGGETWDSIWIDKYLPDPVCEGSILSLGQTNGKNILAFCNPAAIKKRDYLTLRIGFDEGRTWPLINSCRQIVRPTEIQMIIQHIQIL